MFQRNSFVMKTGALTICLTVLGLGSDLRADDASMKLISPDGAALISAGTEVVKVAANQAQKTIELQPNQIAMVELESNASTGYSWYEDLLSDQAIKVLGREYIQLNPGVIGAPGVERFFIAGSAAGDGAIAFAYKRFHESEYAKKIAFRFKAQGLFQGRFSLPVPPAVEPEPYVPGDSYQLPESYNWCDEANGKKCSSVKDQGQCGSCWAFGTIGAMESALMIAGEAESDLSEQFLVSCNADGFSCAGGGPAFNYFWRRYIPEEKMPGTVLEADFPYAGTNAACGGPHNKKHRIDSWYFANGFSPSVDEIKQMIHEYGPVSATVCADILFQMYTTGVYAGSASCTTINHLIALTGWNDAEEYWVLKNSWGASWGMSGYMNIKYNVNAVGSMASFPIYKGESDIDVDIDTDFFNGYDVTADETLDCPTDDQYEENDDIDSAKELEFNKPLKGIVCQADKDYFKFDIKKDQLIELAVYFTHAPTSDLDITLYDSDKKGVQMSATGSSREWITYKPIEAGTHTLEILGYSDATNTHDKTRYTVLLVEPGGDTDGDSDSDSDSDTDSDSGSDGDSDGDGDDDNDSGDDDDSGDDGDNDDSDASDDTGQCGCQTPGVESTARPDLSSLFSLLADIIQ
jgi:inhibitor of cysteine peptidase